MLPSKSLSLPARYLVAIPSVGIIIGKSIWDIRAITHPDKRPVPFLLFHGLPLVDQLVTCLPILRNLPFGAGVANLVGLAVLVEAAIFVVPISVGGEADTELTF